MPPKRNYKHNIKIHWKNYHFVLFRIDEYSGKNSGITVAYYMNQKSIIERFDNHSTYHMDGTIVHTNSSKGIPYKYRKSRRKDTPISDIAAPKSFESRGTILLDGTISKIWHKENVREDVVNIDLTIPKESKYLSVDFYLIPINVEKEQFKEYFEDLYSSDPNYKVGRFLYSFMTLKTFRNIYIGMGIRADF